MGRSNYFPQVAARGVDDVKYFSSLSNRFKTLHNTSMPLAYVHIKGNEDLIVLEWIYRGESLK
jgi:hypothetical protein